MVFPAEMRPLGVTSTSRKDAFELTDNFSVPEDVLFFVMLVGGLCMAYNVKTRLAAMLTPFLIGAVATYAHSPDIAPWIPLAAYSYLFAGVIAYLFGGALGRMVEGWLELFIHPLFGAMFVTLSMQHFAVVHGFLHASQKCGVPWILGGYCTEEDSFQLGVFAAVLVSAELWGIYQKSVPKRSTEVQTRSVKHVKRGRSMKRLRRTVPSSSESESDLTEDEFSFSSDDEGSKSSRSSRRGRGRSYSRSSQARLNVVG